MSKPNCYDCVHRRDLAGNAHSKCEHPRANIGFVVGFGNPLRIIGDPHGIRQGWFLWPINFDPVWLKSCDGFEKKEVNSNMGEIKSSELSLVVSPTNATNATNA